MADSVHKNYIIIYFVYELIHPIKTDGLKFHILSIVFVVYNLIRLIQLKW